MSKITPGFIVAHSHRLQDLTDLVVSISRQYPLPPLASETILVQSNGIAQWLKQHLATGLGIAAMVDVTLPARFQWHAYRAVLGDDLPRHSPFDKERLTWRILRLLPQHLHEPEFEPLRRYMADDTEQRKCFQLSERLADLYDQYQVYRADWLSAWAAGEVAPATPEQLWQPLLWRYLLADVGDARWNNRAYLHQQFIQRCEQLSFAQRPAKIPQRVVVFGISSLPMQTLEVLQALSRFTQVVLCVHNPCQFYWADIIDGHDIYQQQVKSRQRRRHDGELAINALHELSHPLLASWGKQGRDYIRLLDLFDETEQLKGEFPSLKLDMFEQEIPPEPSILDALRYDILQLNATADAKQQWAQTQLNDKALQFHSTHSPQREVEVLHDQLLALFAADPQLKPRDVMVMVPDIDRYAPHIDAVFGRLERSDSRYIPYSIADQGARHQHPMLIALEYILSIRQQRASASEVFDVLQVSAIQQRFGVRSEQLATLQQWVESAGVRWALDQSHRLQLQLPATNENTWLFGLQRMLLGYATGDSGSLDSAWENIEPFTDVGGLEAEIVGALQQLLQVLTEHFHAASETRSPKQWATYLTELLDRLFAPEADADVVMLSRLQQRLQQWVEATESAQLEQAIPLTVVLESWLSSVDEPNLNQRFLAGSVNFATLMPMRAIPFKCVCLLGMNDGDYPRSQKPFDFDLMAHDYRPGDRSRREDDRYLFLEALLSAQQCLYMSWVGRSIRDNSEKPPAVLVSQLLEHIQQTYGARVSGKPWVLEHRLQPFSDAYFSADQPQAQGHFTYAHEWHVVHHDATAERDNAPLPAWLPARPLTLKQLTHFLKEPAKLFTQVRLNTYLSDRISNFSDQERFSLDNLERWQLLQPMFEHAMHALRAGAQAAQAEQVVDAVLAQFQRAGDIPQGAAGVVMKQALFENCVGLLERAEALFSAYPKTCDTIQLQRSFASGLALESTFSGIRENHQGQWLWLNMTPSVVVEGKSLAPRLKHAVQTWLEHVVLNTEHATCSQLLGREGVIVFAPMSVAAAQQYLELLMDWVYDGLQEPLPMEIETALAGIKANQSKTAEASLLNAIHEKAADFYDNDGFHQVAQKRRAIYAARYFPSYAQLAADPRFNEWVQALYQPMMEHVSPAANEVNV